MASRGILPSLADAAWRLLGRPTPQAVVLPTARVDAAPLVVMPQQGADVARTDCGPGGGCAPAPGWGLDDYGPLGWSYVGLNRTTIDYACTEQLMFTIVSALVDDGARGLRGAGALQGLRDRAVHREEGHAREVPGREVGARQGRPWRSPLTQAPASSSGSGSARPDNLRAAVTTTAKGTVRPAFHASMEGETSG